MRDIDVKLILGIGYLKMVTASLILDLHYFIFMILPCKAIE